MTTYKFKITVVDIDEGPFAVIDKTVEGTYEQAINYVTGYIQGLRDSSPNDREFTYEDVSVRLNVNDGIELTWPKAVQERSVMNGN